LAREFQVPVIEDLIDQVPLTDEPVPGPIAALDGNGWIATIGSMSTVFWGRLRVGWIRASERTIFRLAQLKAVADLGTSVVVPAGPVRHGRRHPPPGAGLAGLPATQRRRRPRAGAHRIARGLLE
jgi:hypothetical protein